MFQNVDFQREMLAYEEKVALAKLEESKATERVKELEYQKSRFALDFFLAQLKAQAQQQGQGMPPQEPPLQEPPSQVLPQPQGNQNAG